MKIKNGILVKNLILYFKQQKRVGNKSETVTSIYF